MCSDGLTFAADYSTLGQTRGRAGTQSLAVAVVFIVSVLFVGGCSPPPPDEAGYLERLLEDRALKDQEFEEGESSPVPLDRRFWILPLRYYEPDLEYRVPAQLDMGDDQPVFRIPTSTGLLRSMQRVGLLRFMLNGEPRTLSAFIELPVEEVGRLFVPFRDDTNRTETYPGGRYLDLYQTPTGIYDLDFNRAYNPFCYYSEEFDCPFPPPENRLATAVLAGERLPPEDERPFPITVPGLPEEAEAVPDAPSDN